MNKIIYLTIAMLATFVASVTNVYAVVYVNTQAVGTGDGSSWANAYTDLQPALVNTVNDEIWIGAGTYTPAPANGDTAATFTLKNGVALYGGFNGTETRRDQRDIQTNSTILSGDLNNDDTERYYNFHFGWYFITANAQHVVTADNTDASAIIDGVTISHGVGFRGGGMTITAGSPTISQVTFYGNKASEGGGLYVLNSNLVLDQCTFNANYVDIGTGGGLYIDGTLGGTLSHVEIKNSRFLSNIAISTSRAYLGGGAIYVGDYASAVISDTTFSYNKSDHRKYGSGNATTGGAIFARGAISIDRSSFVNNHSHLGGAIASYSDVNISNTIFSRNWAYGARYISISSPWVRGGYGGAMFLSGYSTPTITLSNVTMSNNKAAEGGGGIYGSVDTMNIYNSIIWGNEVTAFKYVEPGQDIPPKIKSQLNIYSINFNVSYSDIEGLLENLPGEDPIDPAKYPGSIDSDPMFVDVLRNNFRLLQASPAIDAGDNNLIAAGVLTDLDNNTRRVDDPVTADSGNGIAPIVDMGAYEFGGTAPVLSIVSPGDQTNVEGDAVSVSVTTVNPDGLPLSFSATGLPTGLSMDTATGTISGNIAVGASGSYSVTLAATDGTNIASAAFNWTINATAPVNQAPTMVHPGDQSNTEGDVVSIAIQATDLDGDPLTYTIVGAPANLVIDANTGVISGTITAGTAGMYTTTVTVTDGNATVGVSLFWNVVASTPTNPPPAGGGTVPAQDPAGAKIESSGTVEVVGSNYVIASGVKIWYTSTTAIKYGNFTTFVVGVLVEYKGWQNPNGEVIATALKAQ